MAVAEALDWVSVTDRLPDSDTTVLIHSPSASEPVWLGFHDEGWFGIGGEEYGSGDVQYWAVMPQGPAVSAGTAASP